MDIISKGCDYLQLFKKQYGDYKHLTSGKVREVFANNSASTVLLVATDRVSAFDQKLGIEIPDKGKILTAISAEFALKAEKEWGLRTAYLGCSISQLPHLSPWQAQSIPPIIANQPELEGRTTKMQALCMLPVECIVRGYISGSAWKLYEQGERQICGVTLPDGLRNGDKLPSPIFTPTTKAPEGQHDQNITFDEMVAILGGMADKDIAKRIRDMCISLYQYAHDYAYERGIIIADTKFELGYDDTFEICFGDEILTPDSSRFWDLRTWCPGKEPESYDKQIIRNYIADAKSRGEEDIKIPQRILDVTRKKYIELYEKLFGSWPIV